jgi:hypothetical protein
MKGDGVSERSTRLRDGVIPTLRREVDKMVCVPFTPRSAVAAFRPGPADAFAFSAAPDEMARAIENMTALWTAPWRIWMSLAAESLDPGNYAPRRPAAASRRRARPAD